jgi:hypothetical protein
VVPRRSLAQICHQLQEFRGRPSDLIASYGPSEFREPVSERVLVAYNDRPLGGFTTVSGAEPFVQPLAQLQIVSLFRYQSAPGSVGLFLSQPESH